MPTRIRGVVMMPRPSPTLLVDRTSSEQRDIELPSDPNRPVGSFGRNVIAVIGIDRYHHWRRLANAVRDVTGAAALFQRLGFEQITEPLLDDCATGRAINSLVIDDLKALGSEDSLVLFYAGHGGTQKHCVGDRVIKTGYLIPVDAEDKVATWIDLEGWLRAVALLPAKHILVVFDACHSGIALDPILKWRDQGTQEEPLNTLRARRSRRIITSALDDQVALDSGPVHGHSLFTGCLIEGLTYGIRKSRRLVTSSELGLYVQQRVTTYPESQQTPDFGTFALDDRGEMVIQVLIEPLEGSAAILESVPPRGARRDNMPESIFDTEPIVSLKSGQLNGLCRENTPEPSFDTAPAAIGSMPLHGSHHPDMTESRCDTEPVAVLESARLNGSRRNDTFESLDREVVCGKLAIRMASTPKSSVEHVPRGRGRRWIIIGATSAVFAVALSAPPWYTIDSKRLPISDPAHVAIDPPHDTLASAVLDVTTLGQSDKQSLPEQPAKTPPGNCPLGMVLVPAGTFWMGRVDGIGAVEAHRVHEVTLSAYCIDRTEVTVKTYEMCVKAGSCTAAPLTVSWEADLPKAERYHSQFCNHKDRPGHPINCIDWSQAAAYCTWAGRQLPTEAEWEYAARGTDGRTYPWGDDAPTAKRLNACGTECLAMAQHVLNRSLPMMYDADDGWGMTAPAGSFPEGASPFGALDMAGNVWEWTANWDGASSETPAVNPRGVEQGPVRGGGWDSGDADMVYAWSHIWFEPKYRSFSVGFRCVRRL